MTTRGAGGSGGSTALEVKLLVEGEHSLDVLVMPQAKRASIPKSIIQRRPWAGKQVGDRFEVLVPMDFAMRAELVFGEGTLGTRPRPGGGNILG